MVLWFWPSAIASCDKEAFTQQVPTIPGDIAENGETTVDLVARLGHELHANRPAC
jgi:hypothetical protein